MRISNKSDDNAYKKELNNKSEIKSFLNRNSTENPNNISQERIKESNLKLQNLNNFLNNQPSNQRSNSKNLDNNKNNSDNTNNNNNLDNYQNLNNTLNYLSGNTATPTINNYNTIVPEKEKLDNSFRDLKELGKNRVNSRLESLKEQYEIFSSNKQPKDELDITASMLIKDKINKKSNRISGTISNNNNNNEINSFGMNNISTSNNNNNVNYNKISIITPASNRDCGVFDSNFVLKTDKRSFLVNDHSLSKRTTSEDK